MRPARIGLIVTTLIPAVLTVIALTSGRWVDAIICATITLGCMIVTAAALRSGRHN